MNNAPLFGRAWQTTARQLLRYAIVGGASNLIGYSLYLLLTFWGTTPKLTMTFIYVASASIAFIGNRRFTFHHGGHLGAAGLRFILAQGLGYILNLTLLFLFVDQLGYAHQYVQAVSIVVVALFLFVMFRLFVFPQPAPRQME